MTVDKGYFTEDTERCGPASWMHSCRHNITQSAEDGS